MAADNSIVDYLKQEGVKNDFNSRKKLANIFGIPFYKGEKEQNEYLLYLLKKNKKDILNLLINKGEE